ncbi:MAG: transcriptional repressor [Candidatus Fermentibacteraceae bacterium]|nr:transcriptional repressor [Candidatus Fermentibacteraceae bacterium]
MPHCHTYLEKLRESGYRITPQREMIIQIIAHSGRHMTAEEIFEQLREKTDSINIATVYRTLELLVENGLASRSDLGEGNIAYATGEHGAHIHLVCRHCGSVTEVNDVDIDSLLARISEKHDFDCRPGHFAINGICEKCREDL